MDKQTETKGNNESRPIYDTQMLYNSNISLGQYNLFNAFRILRPIRKRYKVTINEVLIVVSAYIYHKHYGSTFSFSGLRNFFSYFNTNKFRYYIDSLVSKGLIVQSDTFSGLPRYRLTETGVSLVNYFDECYNKSLNKFISDFGL